jgi:hypothetical protein
MTVAVRAQPARAQPARADTTHPEFQTVRFKEDWSRPLTGDALDRLKHIALGLGDAWMSLGGHLRARVEYDANYLGGGEGTRDDEFGLVRAHLHLDIHGALGTRVFLEGRVVQARGRDLPGGARTSDRNDLDWGNAFGELRRGRPQAMSTLRYGRQEILLGRERVVSPTDWPNTRRVFQGAVIESEQRDALLTLFWVRPLAVSQTQHDRPQVGVDFWGIHLAMDRARPAALEIHVLGKRVDDAPTVSGERRTSLGARVVQPLSDVWEAELEGGFQWGDGSSGDIRATMFASDLTRRWADARWSPSLSVGADYSSGTRAGRPPRTGTWDVLYTSGHSYLGYADVLGRRNIVEFRAVTQARPTGALRLRGSAHAFRRSSAGDGVYDTGGGLVRASIDGAPRDVGAEFDLTTSWQLGRHLRVDAGGARFVPGGFMRATGAAEHYTWAFASLLAMF